MLIEKKEYNGEVYLRIDPKTVDVTQMEEVHKVKHVMARQVPAGETEKVATISPSDATVETVVEAKEGDWIIYNLADEFPNLKERIKHAYKRVLSNDIFMKLYALKEESDGSNYSDYANIPEEEKTLRTYDYVGKAIYVARVPFNFMIKTASGVDQYIQEGGFLAYNPETSTPGEKDMYGIDGSNDRRPGQLEKSYARRGADKPIEEVHSHIIKADRSPFAGIQFTNKDIAKAYEREGMRAPNKYL